MLTNRVLATTAFALLALTALAVAQPTRQARDAADAACAKGHKLATAKEYEKAIAAFSAAIALDPTADHAYLSRSGVYGSRPDIKNRRIDLAIADLDRLLQLKPGDYSALFNRAGYSQQTGKHQDALADYTQIIEGATNFSLTVEGKDACLSLTHCYRGAVYHGQKDYDRAIKDYTEALRLNPKLNKDDYVYSSRGAAYLAKKEYAEARDDFAAEVKAHPNNAGMVNQLSWLLAACPDAKCRDGRKAVEWAEQAKKLSEGKDPEILNTLAAAHAEMGEFDKAVEWQLKALELLGPKPGAQAKRMEARLALYRAKKPYHDE